MAFVHHLSRQAHKKIPKKKLKRKGRQWVILKLLDHFGFEDKYIAIVQAIFSLLSFSLFIQNQTI